MPIDLQRANNKCKRVLGVDRILANTFNTPLSRIYDLQRLITQNVITTDKLGVNIDKRKKIWIIKTI